MISRQTVWMRQITQRKRWILLIQIPVLFHRICKVSALIRGLLIAYFDTWQKTLLDGNQRGVQNVFLQFLAKGLIGFCILLNRFYTQWVSSGTCDTCEVFYTRWSTLPEGVLIYFTLTVHNIWDVKNTLNVKGIATELKRIIIVIFSLKICFHLTRLTWIYCEVN